jgi:predicted acylesterase/phospholipase RssA
MYQTPTSPHAIDQESSSMNAFEQPPVGNPLGGDEERVGWRPERCDRIALVLQGGGALGAYQAGVYEALHEAGIEPDWVSGVSIGAINAAIIAGNRREQRLERLRVFWERITDRTIWHYTPDGDIYRKARNAASSLMTATQGQPGFFTPRKTNPWLAPAGAKDATSYYDTEPLRKTLLELVDFSLINDRRMRFSVGAVNVRSGNFLYFDNRDFTIEPEHVMASGALPPAFPMTQIGTDFYWDGGIVSNTPLQHVLEEDGNHNMLIFQVDLFSSRRAAARYSGRHGAAEGHHLRVAHPLQYGRLSTAAHMEEPDLRGAEQGAGRAFERRRKENARRPRAASARHDPASDLSATGL